MIIGMLGLIVVALFANIGYYEYMYIKRPKKDLDLTKGYFNLDRIRRGKRV